MKNKKSKKMSLKESFEFPVVNRSLMVLRAKKPYADWVRALPDNSKEELLRGLPIEKIDRDAPAYLIPEIFGDEELEFY